MFGVFRFSSSSEKINSVIWWWRACQGKWSVSEMSNETLQPFERLGITREALLYKPPNVWQTVWFQHKINLPADWRADNKDIKMGADHKPSQMSLNHNYNINACS